MAISKVILNGTTLMDVTTDTVAADKLLSSYTATKNDGTKITGTLQSSSLKTAQGFTTYDANNSRWTLTFSNLTNSPHTFFLMPNTPNIYQGESNYPALYAAPLYGNPNTGPSDIPAYYVIVNATYDGTSSKFYHVLLGSPSYYRSLIDDNLSQVASWSYSSGTLTMICPNTLSITNPSGYTSEMYIGFLTIGELPDYTTPADYILYYT